METWVRHIAKVFSNKETRPMNTDKGEARGKESTGPFTQQGVAEAINSAKNRKAVGPDEIYNEYLKVVQPLLSETWTGFFNRSLEKEIISESWRLSTMKVLYKGKGNICSPDAYQGIAMECTLFKIFTRLITKRLTELVDSQIPPDKQFGFRGGRSTIYAVTNIQNNTEGALRWPRVKTVCGLRGLFQSF
jgi:hypothetical protein